MSKEGGNSSGGNSSGEALCSFPILNEVKPVYFVGLKWYETLIPNTLIKYFIKPSKRSTI